MTTMNHENAGAALVLPSTVGRLMEALESAKNEADALQDHELTAERIQRALKTVEDSAEAVIAAAEEAEQPAAGCSASSAAAMERDRAQEMHDRAEELERQARELRAQAKTETENSNARLEAIKHRADQMKCEAKHRKVQVKICCSIMTGDELFSSTRDCTLEEMVDSSQEVAGGSEPTALDDLARDYVEKIGRRFWSSLEATAFARWRETIGDRDPYFGMRFETSRGLDLYSSGMSMLFGEELVWNPEHLGVVLPIFRAPMPILRRRSPYFPTVTSYRLEARLEVCDFRGRSDDPPFRLVLTFRFQTRDRDSRGPNNFGRGGGHVRVPLGCDMSTGELTGCGIWNEESVRQNRPESIAGLWLEPTGIDLGFGNPLPRKIWIRFQNPSRVRCAFHALEVASKIVAQGASLQEETLRRSKELTDKTFMVALAEAYADKRACVRFGVGEDRDAFRVPMVCL